MTVSNPFTPGVNIAAYLRDSGHEDQDLSIDQQEGQIREFCQQNHLVLAHLYKDAAAPGSSTVGRDQFLEMVHAFRAPGCKLAGLVIWKFNRFARDMDDAQFYKADLRRRGFIIHSLTDNIPDGLDGRFFESAVDWMSARYIEDLRADVKRGQKHLVSTAGGIGGTPPRGFKREEIRMGNRRDGSPHIVHRWVPDPDMVDRVQQAFRMRAEGRSYKEIHAAVQLYRSTPTYATFFSNKIYIGIMEFSDLEIPDYCPAIISPEIWAAVQAIQNRSRGAVRKSEDHPRRNKGAFLLSGLVFCPRCSSAMFAEIVQFRSTFEHRYEYYSCAGHNRHICDARNIPRAPLERAVLEILADVVLAPEFIEARRLQLSQDNEQGQKTRRAEKTRLNRSLQTVRGRMRNITDTIADGGSAVRSLLEKLQQLESEEAMLLAQIANLNKPPAPVPTAEQLRDNMRDILDILSAGDPEQLGAVLRGLIARIIVELDPVEKVIRGVLEYYDPLTAYRASHDALYGSGSYGLTLCPGRDSTLTHKIPLFYSL